MPLTDDPTMLQRLERLGTCVLSDALCSLGVEGAVGGFRRWGPKRVISGRVITVALEPGRPLETGHHLGTQALTTARGGDVIVVANKGRCDAASWGALLTLNAHVNRVSGVVVDGALRDADEIQTLDVPLFARTTTPRSARGWYREASTNKPVEILGVTIQPNDLAVADGSGIVFVREKDVERVLRIAERMSEAEADMERAIRSGSPGADALGARYEDMLDAHNE